MSGETTKGLNSLPCPDMSKACIGCVALGGLDDERAVGRVVYTEENINVAVTDGSGKWVTVAISEPKSWSGEKYADRSSAANDRMDACVNHAMDDRFMATRDCPAGLSRRPEPATRKPSPRPR